MSLIGSSHEDLVAAAHRLVDDGALVAFPTETVYGLGANALSESAASRIYAVKGRPPTDPLICHVAALSEVSNLWDASTEARRRVVELGLALGDIFWPGPITFVAHASPVVAPCVTGGSGCVGARIPNHSVALAFLRACRVPVAAPSANTFGHVSPTTAQHVMADLAARDPTLTVVDGGSSSIGIESTVVRLHEGDRLEVLRRGKIGVTDLQRALLTVAGGKFATAAVTIRDTRSKFVGSETQPMDGPGQLLTHYSPSIPCFLVTPSSVCGTAPAPTAGSSSTTEPAPQDCNGRGAVIHANGVSYELSSAVVLDFKGLLRGVLTCAQRGVGPNNDESSQSGSNSTSSWLAYRSLSDGGCVDEACHAVFDALRWVECVSGARVAIFPLLSEWVAPTSDASMDELLAAVEDRLFRAASGVVATVTTV